ncbi:MAG: 4'-phosphopantetheinyl transferase superfamily protein [Thermodesulfobacteriota bacterium]
MTSIFPNNIKINILCPKKEVIIWYARIPKIIESIFHKKSLPDFKQMKNRIFDKEDFIQSFLNKDEINTLNGFKALKKQIEWISGRYLIKLMIQYNFLQHLPLNQITISYLDEGAPFLTHDPDIPVSLSHSNNYTAAACCLSRGKAIGIDIEKIAKKPDAWFLKTAFTKKEILHLEDNADSIFKNWTIKEAYLKQIKKGFNESLHKVEVIDNEIWHNKKQINIDVYSTFINDYVLSLVSD